MKLARLNALFLTCVLGLFSSSLFAMGTTQCSTPTEEGNHDLRRVEEEIWGRNIIEWYYQGEPIDAEEVKVDTSTVKILSQSRLEDDVMGERVVTDYEVTALLLKSPEGSPIGLALRLICQTEEFLKILD